MPIIDGRTDRQNSLRWDQTSRLAIGSGVRGKDFLIHGETGLELGEENDFLLAAASHDPLFAIWTAVYSA